MTFERNQNWFGGDANQTLEPGSSTSMCPTRTRTT